MNACKSNRESNYGNITETNIKTKTEHITTAKLVERKLVQQRANILDFQITLGKYSSFIHNIVQLAKHRSRSMICVANVHMFIEAYKSKEFMDILNNADIITPDGRPLVWSLKLLYGIKQDRVCGMDILPELLAGLMKEKLPVYFLGGEEEMLWKTEEFIKEHYPGLPIAGYYSPPFRTLTNEENIEIIDDINRSKAAIVFVVLGCPKQEKLMASIRGKINATMIGIGGALPVMIGEKRRAPKWMQLYGFEWLFRFSQEPKRLFKRYTSTNFFFLYLILKEIAAVRLFGRKRNRIINLYQ